MARLAYLGTPELAVEPLRALVDAGHEVVLVVTRPDRRRGRGGATSPSPVKAAALALGLAVSDDPGAVATSGAELGVVVAYGRIIRPEVLAAVPMVNLHFSMLPRWRGAAPVERAILAGDTMTGVCVMAVAEGLDTGDVYACTEVAIGDDSLAVLRQRLVATGASTLVELLSGGVAGLPEPSPQRGTPSYAEKIDRHELELHWERPAVELARVVRLGRAHTRFRGRRLGVVEARPTEPRTGAPGALEGAVVATGNGGLELLVVQPEGARPMDASAWRRGARPTPGERLG